MLRRPLFNVLEKNLTHKNALVVVGIRQVGKTTLLRQLFSTITQPKVWLDLDNPLDQLVLEDIDYNNIYQRLLMLAGNVTKNNIFRLYVFIDEIQNYPNSTKVMKYLIDHYNVKFIVTGSSSFYLKNLFPESLSGRKFLYKLNPLNFREFLYFKKVVPSPLGLISFDSVDSLMYVTYLEHYNEFLEFGGFPEVVLTAGLSAKKEILRNIFKSFFEKDLQLISDYKDIKELRDLIILLSQRVGSLLDITRLSQELGVSRPKLYSYLEFLQGTFFIRMLTKYSKSIDRSVAGGNRVYFADTGILNILSSVDDAKIFENAVVNQLSDYGDVSFYNKRNSYEIDVILNKEIAFETKLTGGFYDYKDLQKSMRAIGITKGYIISKKYVKSIENNILLGACL